jgi:hypothetical protein
MLALELVLSQLHSRKSDILAEYFCDCILPGLSECFLLLHQSCNHLDWKIRGHDHYYVRYLRILSIVNDV